jgi:hypothetical protein
MFRAAAPIDGDVPNILLGPKGFPIKAIETRFGEQEYMLVLAIRTVARSCLGEGVQAIPDDVAA